MVIPFRPQLFYIFLLGTSNSRHCRATTRSIYIASHYSTKVLGRDLSCRPHWRNKSTSNSPGRGKSPTARALEMETKINHGLGDKRNYRLLKWFGTNQLIQGSHKTSQNTWMSFFILITDSTLTALIFSFLRCFFSSTILLL